jgi:hypothetical protein
MVVADRRAAVVLCDRGTVDGLAYWDGDPDRFWTDVHTSSAAELGRDSAVIHLRTPAQETGYDRSPPLRIETAAEDMTLNREKLAELTSGFGAVVLGVGIGVYAGSPLKDYAPWFVSIGILLHGWGMFDRHRALVHARGTPPWWWRALYIVCWAALVALLGYVGATMLQ